MDESGDKSSGVENSATSIAAFVDSGKCFVSSPSNWIIDYGVDHMTDNHSLLCNFSEHRSFHEVKVANGSILQAIGSGTIFQQSKSLVEDENRVDSYIFEPEEVKTQFGVSVKTLRSDNVKEYTSDAFRSFMLRQGIHHESSCVDTPAQNGVVERKNRHLLEVARALLFQMTVLKPFWADAIATACFLINRMPSAVLHGEIPMSILVADQRLFLIEPKIFGCSCFVRDTLPHLSKLDPKTLKCVFLGYSRLQKGYRCFSLVLNRYIISRDVTFTEEVPFYPVSTCRDQENQDDLLIYSIPTLSSTVDFQVPSASESSLEQKRPPVIHVYNIPYADVLTSESPSTSDSDVAGDSLPPDHDVPIALRKGKRSCTYPVDSYVSYAKLSRASRSLVGSLDSIPTPKSVGEALAHPRWRNAMIEEINALEDNNMWTLVELPTNKKTIGCKWVFTVKVNPDGSVARLKARLVAKGYAQTYGLTIQRHSLQLLSYHRCSYDHSVFYASSESGCILLVVYVDDIIVTGSDENGIKRLKEFLASQFQTKDLGPLKCFLGNEVSRNRKGICLSQRKYYILHEFGMIDAKPCEAPMIPSVKLKADDGDPLENPERYRRVVGRLNYLTIPRPDIAFPVSVVSQFMSSPRTAHWDAVCHILKYLKGAPGYGIKYQNHCHHNIEGFTDADYDGDPTSRRSTTGYCVFVGGNLVSWRSKKQNLVSRSSAESEYRAMAQTTCELIWLHNVLGEIGLSQSKPMNLWCDNKAAVHIQVFHEKTKHIEVDCHFTWEKLEDGTISTPHVRTRDQLADVFTKALPVSRVTYICSKLGMINIYAPA
ncbi:hypothetical protein OSB04_032266 [Centaurea solstitialis]|uniref:Integrase catalytic domain-containing protein n=1 Tax=Centaurea solstitialis TaxID=347529 RepID=A0AA38SC01_9ASTR|nr:hypothetical protein OSB04_032266 [Centaurea solstitialis]